MFLEQVVNEKNIAVCTFRQIFLCADKYANIRKKLTRRGRDNMAMMLWTVSLNKISCMDFIMLLVHIYTIMQQWSG